MYVNSLNTFIRRDLAPCVYPRVLCLINNGKSQLEASCTVYSCVHIMVTAVIGSITIGLRTCGVCVVMIMCVHAKLTSDPVTVYIHVGDLPKC